MKLLYASQAKQFKLGELFGVMEYDFIEKLRPQIILPTFATYCIGKDEFTEEYDGDTMTLVAKTFTHNYFTITKDGEARFLRVSHSPFIENMLTPINTEVVINPVMVVLESGKHTPEYSMGEVATYIDNYGKHQNEFVTQREPFDDTVWRAEETTDFPHTELNQLKLELVELRYNRKRLDTLRDRRNRLEGRTKNVSK